MHRRCFRSTSPPDGSSHSVSPTPSPTIQRRSPVTMHPDLRSPSRSSVAVLIGRALQWLDAVPYTVLAIPLRLAVATVFWNSAMTKLANWDTAVALFVEEYKVPLIPPEILG